MGWVGTLVVARVSLDGRTKGDRKGCRLPRRPSPTPHPNLSLPYEDEAASQACLQKTYPCKAPLARLGKWATVVRHLPLGQATQDLPGQDLFFPCAPPMASQAKKATFLWNWFIVCSSLASICAIIREDNRSVGWSRFA